MHTKWHPTFVSDATTNDVNEAIDLLQDSPSTVLQTFGADLLEHKESKRLKISDNMVWTNPMLFNKLSPDMVEGIKHSNLIIFKGDANYRRLVFDTKWPMDKSFESVTKYFWCPVAALRTIKAELCFGISAKQQEKIHSYPSNWQETGDIGIIQFKR